MSSENSKKQFIDALIERVYQNDKVKHIFTESLDELQKSAEDKYLSSNLSMDEIADKILYSNFARFFQLEL